MAHQRKHITVFEHQAIKVGQVFGDITFDKSKFEAFQRYHDSVGSLYYSLIYNGIRFKEYVGAIQVGDLLVEVLPKADKLPQTEGEEAKWRNILVDMVRAVSSFDVKATSSSNLKVKPNSILDLYFELFVKEVEYLLHSGLVKRYRKTEGNVTALKGSLQFGKHIQQNLIHKERFYVRHSTYDTEHQLHFILYKTIRLLKHINTNVDLHSRIGSLLLYFPEMPDVKVSEATFNSLMLNRKTQGYKKAMDIARLILLQYHPDVAKGRNDVLALMFDMNLLWEQFVYVSLRKHIRQNLATSITITAQTSKFFWQPDGGSRSKIRPDIVINKDKPDCVVIDTKWKNLNGYNPSPDDLRQMYVYHDYYHAKRVALMYPCDKSSRVNGKYLDSTTSVTIDKECSVIFVSVESNIKEWQKMIYNEFECWLMLP